MNMDILHYINNLKLAEPEPTKITTESLAQYVIGLAIRNPNDRSAWDSTGDESDILLKQIKNVYKNLGDIHHLNPINTVGVFDPFFVCERVIADDVSHLSLIMLYQFDKRVEFWRESGKNGWASNWYEDDLYVFGETFKTSEHFLMYGKACLFGDIHIANEIMLTTNPAKVKSLGRLVRYFKEETWYKLCCGIMLVALESKFDNREFLKSMLMATGYKAIIEASPYDEIWGVKLPMGDARVKDPRTWGGTNYLGALLMIVRSKIRYRESKKCMTETSMFQEQERPA